MVTRPARRLPARRRPRRMMRRGLRRGLMPRVRQPVQYYKQRYQPLDETGNPINIQVTNAGPVTTAVSFLMSQLPQWKTFEELYDQYKCLAVKIEFVPRVSSGIVAVGGGIGGNPLSNFWSCLDYDDATPPATLAEVLQYQNVKRTRHNQVHSRYLKPRMVLNTSGLAATPGAVTRSPWLDCADHGQTLYRGVKCWFEPIAAADTTIVYDVYVTAYVAFKNVR